jgi:hypothetical protein
VVVASPFLHISINTEPNLSDKTFTLYVTPHLTIALHLTVHNHCLTKPAQQPNTIYQTYPLIFRVHDLPKLGSPAFMKVNYNLLSPSYGRGTKPLKTCESRTLQIGKPPTTYRKRQLPQAARRFRYPRTAWPLVSML